MMGSSTIAEARRDLDWAGAKQWMVLRTRSRQEKAVAEMLDASDAEYFLPLVRKERRYGRTRNVVDFPLFPGYVFLHGTRDEAFEVDRSRRLASIIEVPDQERLERELGSIRLAVEAGVGLEPTDHLPVGTRVRVRRGALEGVEGCVERHSTPYRLYLQVNTLGQAVTVDVDVDDLEPVE